MKLILVVCLLAVYLADIVLTGDEYVCECRYDDCLEGDTNEGDCTVGLGSGNKCCWEEETDCQCKEFCNTDERRHRTCGGNGQYGYCCKYPRRYN